MSSAGHGGYFSQTESTSEQFRPNQTPDSSAVRSQQVLESR